jgi:hypothetical protein
MTSAFWYACQSRVLSGQFLFPPSLTVQYCIALYTVTVPCCTYLQQRGVVS